MRILWYYRDIKVNPTFLSFSKLSGGVIDPLRFPIFPLKKFEQDDREVMTPREEAFQAENKEVDISFEEAQNEINSTLDFEIENYKVFD